MYVANNGAAIIAGVMVPAAEVSALKTLVQIGRPATVPEVARAMDNKMSDASLYKLLSRLCEQRRLVTRREAFVDVQGASLRRVLWQANQAATLSFNNESGATHAQSIQQRTPAEAAG